VQTLRKGGTLKLAATNDTTVEGDTLNLLLVVMAQVRHLRTSTRNASPLMATLVLRGRHVAGSLSSHDHTRPTLRDVQPGPDL